MKECFSKSFIRNGSLKDRSGFKTSGIFKGKTIYEVIRIIDGVPVFFDDHFDRLEESTRLSRKKLLSDHDDLYDHIQLLIRKEGLDNGNIKVVFNYSGKGNKSLVYFIESHYPEPELYSTGILGILYYGERKNPVAKIFNYKLRSSIFNALISQNAYEALLVDRSNCITEGSRSNIFFLNKNKLITAPDERVLCGITRKYVIKIARQLGIEIIFKCLPVDELKNVNLVFLTGTSPNILPFRQIDDLEFNLSDPLVNLLSDHYARLINEYVDENKSG